MRDSGSVAGTLLGNRRLSRLVASYLLFVVFEYAVWIAVLVYAYGEGGATEAGVVGLVQLAPAALLAPFLASIADRGSPIRVLLGGYGVQAVATGAAALAVAMDARLPAYAAAVVASTAVVTVRPAQAVLLPGLVQSAAELTAANVALGWMENSGIVLAGLVAGLLLGSAGPALALAAMGAVALVCGALVRPFGAGKPGGGVRKRAPGHLVEVLRLLVADPAPRVLLALLTAEFVIVGALDVLFVVLALDVLDKGQSWAGYLQMAAGAGGFAAGMVTARLVGRRLATPILLSSLVFSGALALTATRPGPWATAALLSGAGAGRAVLDVAARTLLQRVVPTRLLGRAFGVLEGLSMAGLALGSLLVPIFASLGGASIALLGVAAVLPAALLLGLRPLLTLDGRASLPVVETTLLLGMPLFRHLPTPALEGLAHALERQDLAAGTVLIREGDQGDHYYAIASGDLEIFSGGHSLGLRGRGDGVGEIALLRNVVRTATVITAGPTVVYRLDREPFLTAVIGHAETSAAADMVVEQRLRNPDSAGDSQ